MSVMTFRASMEKQSGYATVFGALLAVAMMLSIFSLYDVGQVSSNKIKIQNAIDAGVYSTSTTVARDMNFMAYTNRAMVANQVAIAQMVGLSSFVHMIEQSTDNMDKIGRILRLIPFVGWAISAVITVLDKAADVLKKAIDTTAKIVIPLNNAIIAALSGAQFSFHGALVGTAPFVFRDVVKANDKDVEQPLLLGAAAVADYIDEYNKTLEYNTSARRNPRTKIQKLHLKRFNEFHSITHESRDPFSANRKNKWIDFSFAGHGLKVTKYGGSDLNRKARNGKYVYEWTAMDTVGLNLKVPLIGALLGGETDLPIGWGSAQALDRRSARRYDYTRFNRQRGSCWRPDRGRWGNGAWRNKNAACFEAYSNGRNKLSNFGGLKPFYDLQDDGLIDRGPSFIASVRKTAKKTRVWKEASKDIPQYNLQPRFDIAEQGGLARDQMMTLAKSEVYFSRAPDLWRRSPAREVEFGNLYNPFWQARLIEASAAERGLLLSVAAGISL